MVTTAAARAFDYIEDGMVVGLGSGRAADAFVEALSVRVAAGLRIDAVPTSHRTQSLAEAAGLRLRSFDAVDHIDVTVDGADEVDPELNLIKGYGGALLREKIVAASSRCVVIVVDASKLVPRLGTRGRLPVEVVPFGWRQSQRRLATLDCPALPRETAGGYFVTDNGNYILDCGISPIVDPAALDHRIRGIPGVVATGLFLCMVDVVLVQAGAVVEVRVSSR
ncbi:MAG: ribose-5-phosphate isomerase RpiA [Planctomycetota bacterium]|nr:ribose-5-phosphate isomerase RpiA [Planctomycetota bacterium]